MSYLGDSTDLAPRGFTGLPPRTRPGDYDPARPARADGDPDQLWAGCTGGLQEQIAMQFARARADDVRDALLDAQVPERASTRATERALGAALWRAWICYRDQVLDRLHRKGRLELE